MRQCCRRHSRSAHRPIVQHDAISAERGQSVQLDGSLARPVMLLVMQLQNVHKPVQQCRPTTVLGWNLIANYYNCDIIIHLRVAIYIGWQ